MFDGVDIQSCSNMAMQNNTINTTAWMESTLNRALGNTTFNAIQYPTFLPELVIL